MKVNFIIVGAMKSGTTSLHHLMQSHAEVEMATPKEPQFFSNESDWEHHLDRYHSFFPDKQGVIFGESSTNYTKYPNIKNLELVEDIRDYNPEMKFIYMIRHPVDRTLSQYMHIFQTGYTKLPIDRALREDPQLLTNSRYYLQIRRFLDVFDKDRLMLIKFEDFIGNQSAHLREIADFLNIDEEGFAVEEMQSNPSEKGEFVDHRIEQLFHGNLWIKEVLPKSLIKRTRSFLSTLNPRRMTEKPKLSRAYQEVILRATALDIQKLEQEFNMDLSDYYEVRNKHLPE